MREAPLRTREKTSGTQGNVYRSRVWITLLLVRVGFVNMMWEGQQNLSVSVQGSWHPLSSKFKCENNNNKKASLHSFVYLLTFPC